MFGSNDSNQQTNDDPAMLDNVRQLSQDPADTAVSTPPSTSPPVNPFPSNSQFTPTNVPSTTTPPQDQSASTPAVQAVDDPHRAEPAEGFSSIALPVNNDPSPAPDSSTDTADDQSVSAVIQSTSTPVQETQASDTNTSSQSSDSASDTQQSPQSAPDQNHLAGLKQQALQHLEPLADHVDGTPEEMFKTTMMMIQANDNHTLLEKALEAAKNIEDDKVRAKAMLDVINEINYFSQANDTVE